MNPKEGMHWIVKLPQAVYIRSPHSILDIHDKSVSFYKGIHTNTNSINMDIFLDMIIWVITAYQRDNTSSRKDYELNQCLNGRPGTVNLGESEIWLPEPEAGSGHDILTGTGTGIPEYRNTGSRKPDAGIRNQSDLASKKVLRNT